MTNETIKNTIRIIVDTHILVYREFDGYAPAEYLDLIKCINKTRVPILLHPLSLFDIEKDANLKNKGIILSKVRNYPQLKSPPDANDDEEFQNIIETSTAFRDSVDNQLLYCVYKNVADVFITDDRDIHRKAKSLKISDRVLSVIKATDFLKNSYDVEITSGTHASKPTICFFNNGDYWKIGEKGRETLFKEIRGFRYISFLLQYPNKSFPALDVYSEGKTLPEVFEAEVAFSDSLGIDSDVLKLVTKNGRIPFEEIKRLISYFEKKIETNDYNGIEEAIAIKENISNLAKMLKTKVQRDHTSQAEKARVNVTKRIHAALKKINEKLPALGLYLNKSTIKTGDSFCHIPVVGQEPDWILQKYPSSK